MDPVWFVRSRQVAARFRFWLALFGYNPRDRSLSHRIYLVYAAVFYTLWGFALLTLVAGGAGRVLKTLLQLSSGYAWMEAGSLQAVARTISALGLAAWALLAGYKASRRSPIRFSEEDAHLICQTPVDRRRVALAWLFGQWLESAPIAGAAAVIIGFGLVEAGSPEGLSGEDLPRYLLAGIRSLSVVLPLHLALTALVWTLGVMRLQRDRVRPKLTLIPIGLGVLLLSLIIFPYDVSNNSSFQLIQPDWFLWPLTFPLSSAYAMQPWLNGLLFGLLAATGGLLILALASSGLTLSRAALESQGIVRKEAALLTGNLAAAEELDKRERLGIGRKASAWLASKRWEGVGKDYAGPLALLLKDRVQAGRTRRVWDLFSWLSLFSLILGIFVIADPGVRIFSLLMYLNLFQALATRRLQADLRLWGLLRQIPVSGGNMVLANAAVPVILAALLAWAALQTGTALAPVPFLPELRLLFPFLALNIALAGAMDVLRQSKSADLLTGNAPQPGMLGIAISAALSVATLFLLSRFVGAGAFLSLFLLGVSARLLYLTCQRRMRKIQ